MNLTELTATSKLTYCPLPSHAEMAEYTHLELSSRPYKYSKGEIDIEVKRDSHDITVDKKTYEFKVVV